MPGQIIDKNYTVGNGSVASSEPSPASASVTLRK